MIHQSRDEGNEELISGGGNRGEIREVDRREAVWEA